MLVLCFVPHAALILQNCSIMAQLSQTLDSSLYLNTEVNDTLALAETVFTVQEERLFIAKFLYLDSSVDYNVPDKSTLLHIFAESDRHLHMAYVTYLPDRLKGNLVHYREDVLHHMDWTKIDSLRRSAVYKQINSILLLRILRNINSTAYSLWRQLSASYELVKSVEELSLALTLAIYNINHELSFPMMAVLQKHMTLAMEHLQTMTQHLEVEDMMQEARIVDDMVGFYKRSNLYNPNGTFLPEPWGDSTNLYIFESEEYLKRLRHVQSSLWAVVRESVKREVWLARRTLGMGVGVLALVLLASPILILLLRHTVFTKSIELSTQRLVAEKQKSDLLLSRMLPLPVLRRLRAQKTVPAESFDAVTIFFSDIVGFTNISANSTPMEIINMLNMLYKLFDEKIMEYNVYKVETIGDAYMVVSGLPQRNGNRHASEIADMSLSLMRSLEGAKIPHRPQETLRIRAGINTGPCVAGVVGTTMPRYCLFGDTINTASRMESTGEAMKIHISQSTKEALDEIGNYLVESRGFIDVAGKGSMETFWLVGKVGELQSESPRCLRLHDYDQNVIELLIRP
ncbi:uncharacterized protein [Epargyreus clarus]|uniref:uncharacterized protein isoform X2 n=1 Tax=Epargyreus clarus TaxID=520877 RepID=UPI003C2BB28B